MTNHNLALELKRTKRKFFGLTLLGVALITIISLVSMKIHSDAIEDHKKLEKIKTLYNQIQNTNQELMINYQKIKGFHSNEELFVESSMIKVKEKVQLNIDKIKTNVSSLRNLLLDDILVENHLLLVESLELDENLLELIKLIVEYDISTSSKSTSSENSILINNKVKNLKTDIDLSLISLKKNIDKESAKLIQRIEDIGRYLIILSILQVLLIWVLIFKPMYSALIDQHSKVEESILEAQSANRSKTQFLANVSHEIRTPMTAIIGYIELFHENKIKSESKDEVLQIIKDNGDHLLGLIDEILEISKIESGKFVFKNEPMELNKIFSSIYNLLKSKAHDKNIELSFEYDGEVPQTILIDPKRLKQILFNIIGNAIKFTQKGSVKVIASFNQETKRLSINVIDTGIGIDSKNIKYLFKPFGQIDSSVSRKFGGTGLGLVLSKKLAEAMNGDIKIKKSVLGQGTNFEITFNSLENDEKFITKFNDQVNVEQDDKKKKNNKPLSSYSILVIDDAKENTFLFKMYLEEAGASVEVGYDGTDALKQTDNSHFDLILMDLQMPGMDGYTAIHELRMKNFEGPIVALTAHALEEERQKTSDHGFSGHITKPVNNEFLVSQVLEIIRKKPLDV